MQFIEYLKDNTILVVPNSMKKKVLKNIDQLKEMISVKIISLEELKKKFYFDYDEATILYLMEQHHYCYEVAKTLIDNMYYVEDRKYQSYKLNHLVSLKKELMDQHLLYFDSLFGNYVKDKHIVVYGYDYLDTFYEKILSSLSDVHVIKEEVKFNNKPIVYECNTIFDEVDFVMHQIALLLKDGSDIKKIKLCNIDQNYYHTLKILSKFYHIPVAIPVNEPLIATKSGQAFVRCLKESNSLEECLNNVNLEVLNPAIVSILNRFIGISASYSLIREAILSCLMKVKISSVSYSNQVEIIPLYDYVLDDEYVFLMGFNQGICPSIKKDEDYISDYLKPEVGLDSVNIDNARTKESIMSKIQTIKHLIITYKQKSIKEVYYPSNLIQELNLEVIIHKEDDCHYAKSYSEIKLGKMLDEWIKYDVKDKRLDTYYRSLKIPYLKYENQFTGIASSKLLPVLNNKLLLSYTTLDHYYRCGFRYYLANVLKLDKYEETFSTLVGNLYHDLLSKCLTKDFEFDREWDHFLQGKTLANNEVFFLIKLKEELVLVIEEVKRLHRETGLTDYMLEKKIYIDKSTSIPITFMGIIDKIMYKHVDGKDLIAIIDYKTGTPNINLFDAIYGIDMQLPIYLYLVQYSHLFTDPSFVGFYLQKVLHGEVTRNSNKTYLEQKKEHLKLSGYSTTDEGILARFDPTYENSDFIKSMKMTNKGFYSYSKVIEDEKIKMLIKLVDSKIDVAITDILASKFNINPKRIGTENIGCLYCKFQDICYRREEDFINLKEYKDLSFLGGDKNA